MVNHLFEIHPSRRDEKGVSTTANSPLSLSQNSPYNMDDRNANQTHTPLYTNQGSKNIEARPIKMQNLFRKFANSLRLCSLMKLESWTPFRLIKLLRSMNMDQNKSFGLIKLRRTKKVQIPLSFQSSLWIKSVE